MAEETPDTRELSPRQQRAMQEARIADLKNRSVIPALEVMANEMEARVADGSLAKEMKGMKAASIIHNLTKILASIKTAAVIVAPQVSTQPQRDQTRLRADSAAHLTPYEREKRRKAADQAVDAELVDEDE